MSDERIGKDIYVMGEGLTSWDLKVIPCLSNWFSHHSTWPGCAVALLATATTKTSDFLTCSSGFFCVFPFHNARKLGG